MPGHAHRRDISYADAREQGRTLELQIDLDPHDTPLIEQVDRNKDGKITTSEIASSDSALQRFVLDRVALKKAGEQCSARSPQTNFFADVQMWHLGVTYDCPGPAADFALYLGYIDSLSPSHRAIFKLTSEGHARIQSVVEAGHAVIEARNSGWFAVGARFVRLGVHHILDGLDHLAFIFALILASRSFARALLLLSAFTVAHSVSLFLSALSIIKLPEQPVEVVIALSIAVVAFEALRERDGLRARLLLTFSFGFVHGLGFASVLADALLSTSAFVWSLLCFNIGIELGQAALVACALPLVLFVRKHRPNAVKAASVLVGLLGLCWAIRRALAAG